MRKVYKRRAPLIDEIGAKKAAKKAGANKEIEKTAVKVAVKKVGSEKVEVKATARKLAVKKLKNGAVKKAASKVAYGFMMKPAVVRKAARLLPESGVPSASEPQPALVPVRRKRRTQSTGPNLDD